jgi:tRNA pseudouridine38-40 synthase
VRLENARRDRSFSQRPHSLLFLSLRNPGARTIEAELERVLHEVGLIEDKDFGDLAAVGWNRAARTDKGVHAAGAVVSLRMRIAEGSEDAAIESINAHLPDDLRVFNILKTTAQFNSKNFCSGRRYGYLLPTFMLRQVGGLAALSAAAASSRVHCSGQRVEAVELIAADPFCNGTAAVRAASELAQARARHWRTTAALQSESPLSTLLPLRGKLAPISRCFEPDVFQSGAAAVQAAKELRMMRASATRGSSAISAAAASSFRLSEVAWHALCKHLARYKGTHAYHNFSPRLSAGDATSARYVTESTATRPFLIDGTEYVHVTIVGQSFLLNQIRHMVGLVVDCVRGAAPELAMTWAFSAGKLKVPLAPAEGLYLDACFFDVYDRNYTGGSSKSKSNVRKHPSLMHQDASAVERTRLFKENVIWPHMAKTTLEPFLAFAAELTQSPLRYELRFADQALQSAARRSGAEDFRTVSALQSVIQDGGAVSKVAREKSEWKRKLKQEKEAIRQDTFKKRQEKFEAKVAMEGAVAVPATQGEAESEAAPAEPQAGGAPMEEESASRRSGKGGSRGRGFWRGGRGFLAHRSPTAAQTWRPPKKARLF